MVPLRSRFIAVAAVTAALAACPKPAPEEAKPPPDEEAAAPPVVEEAPPPPPPTPGVVYFRRAKAGTEVVLADVEKLEKKVLHTLTGSQREAMTVEGELYAVVTEAKSIDGEKSPAKKGVVTIVVGELGRGRTAMAAGAAGCKAHRCFEGSPLFAPDGASVVTRLMRSNGTDLRRYDVAELRGEALGRGLPSMKHPVLSPDHRRLAYAEKRRVRVIDLGGGPEIPIEVTGLRDQPLLLALDAVVYERDDRGAVLEMRDLATGETRVIHRLAGKMKADAPRFLRPEEREVITVEPRGGALAVIAVPLGGGGARTLVERADELLDVSSDGRWLLVRADEGGEPVLVVHDLVANREAGRLTFADEATPTGARLAL